MVKWLKPLDDRVVIFGMSCVGKTTFARLFPEAHRCFDALFPWHLIETFGLSTTAALEHVRRSVGDGHFVLDGWHLADRAGHFLPPGAAVYVVYAPYDQILAQYRIPVIDHEEFRPMFDEWYRSVPYDELPGTRYFRNAGEFVETDREAFLISLPARSR